MRISLVLFSIFFSFVCDAQLSSYLDSDYGDNGIVTIQSSGHPFYFYNFSLDSQGRAYISSSLLHQHPLDSIYSTAILKRIDKTGKIEDWGIDIRPDSNSSPEDSLLILAWQSNDHLYSYITDEEDNSSTILRFDLELNRETEFQAEANRNILFNYAFNNGEFLTFDENEKLYIHHDGHISRYNTDGLLDQSFADEGTTKVYDFQNLNDSLWHNFYSDMKVVEDGLIYSTILFVDSLETLYKSVITKLDFNGQIDTSFGESGRFYSEENEIIFSIHESIDGNYKYLSAKDIEQCQFSRTRVSKLTHDGYLDLNYGSNGTLDGQSECHGSDLSFLEGPEGYQLINQIDSIIYDADSTSLEYKYRFALYSPDGNLDTSFANKGILALDFVPGDYYLFIEQDEDNNVYISSIDTASYIPIDNDIYITKFKANKIWPSLKVEPEPEMPTQLLSLYPNPTTNGITLHYQGPELENVSIEVINMLGQRVGILERQTFIPGTETYLDTYAYPSGQYFIRVIGTENKLRLLEEKFTIIE